MKDIVRSFTPPAGEASGWTYLKRAYRKLALPSRRTVRVEDAFRLAQEQRRQEGKQASA